MMRLIPRIFRRLVAAATLIAVAGLLVPAAAASVDRHCAPGGGHGVAITAGPAAGCHQAAGAPCATGGCLVAPAALLLSTAVEAVPVADHTAVLPLIGHLTDLPALGPPTPPPNS